MKIGRIKPQLNHSNLPAKKVRKESGNEVVDRGDRLELSGKSPKPGKMTRPGGAKNAKKPWTVLVYSAGNDRLVNEFLLRKKQL